MKKILACFVFFFWLHTSVFAQYELKFSLSPVFTHFTTDPSNVIDDIYTYNIKSEYGNFVSSTQFSTALYKMIKPDVYIGISAGIRNSIFLYIDTRFDGKSGVGLNETYTVIGEFQIRERVFNALMHIEKRFLANRKLYIDGSVGFSRFNSNSLWVVTSTTLLDPERYQE